VVASLIHQEIFRAYDIRGIVDQTLTEETVFLIGKAIGSKTILSNDNQQNLTSKQVIVGRDGRLSGSRLIDKLKTGIISTGCDVIDLGLIPTPVLYFAANILNIDSAVMLTGSHNPPNYNGLKIILSGQAIYGEQIIELKNLITQNRLINVAEHNIGKIIEQNMIDQYINYIVNNINIVNVNKNHNKKIKIVIDCGNGAAAVVAEKLFTCLGAECISLYCTVDGNFPNHHPDPSDPKNLQDLKMTVLNNQADLGIAFDGDGDRLGVVDNKGNIIWPDRYLMLFAKDILAKNNNITNQDPVIIYDVKCTNNLHDIITTAGGVPLMWKTGHSLIKAKMQETKALLAGEMSGHVFFKDRWFGFDDGLYTAARLLELLFNSQDTLELMCSNLPENCSTPELTIKSSESRKHYIMKNLIEAVQEKTAKITLIDGLRLDFADCWGLVRMSNTTPNLIARFEAINLSSLNKVKKIFKDYLLAIDANLVIPF